MDQMPIVLEDYLNYLKTVRGLSPKTVQEYGYDLLRFLRFLARRKGPVAERKLPLEEASIQDMDEKDLARVQVNDLLAFLAYTKDQALSASRRARMTSALRSFYKYLVHVQEYFEKNPAEKLTTPKRKKRQPVYLTLEEALSLIQVAAQQKDPFLQTRDVAILLTFLTSGIRLSELCDLNLSSIREGRLQVIGKGNKERQVFLSESARHALDLYLAKRPHPPEGDALFLSRRRKRISPRAVQHRIDHFLREAGLDTRIFSTHKLRHTAATLMYREGVDIRTLQKILGHESLQTTQIYTHVGDQMEKAAIEKNPLSSLSLGEDRASQEEGLAGK